MNPETATNDPSPVDGSIAANGMAASRASMRLAAALSLVAAGAG
jgi:hypothetical protein